MVPRDRLDPEIAAVLEPMAATAAGAAPIERGDWRALRERANTNLAFLATLKPEPLLSVIVVCTAPAVGAAAGWVLGIRTPKAARP